MLDHSPVEQPLVSLLQRRQLHVTVDVARQPFEVHHYPVHHLPRRRHAVGQQPSQSQALSLAPRKGDGSVQRLVAQNFEASFHDLILLSIAEIFTTSSCHRHRHDHRHRHH